MSEQENVQRVPGVYAAFGRGDIPAFMDALSDDVEWIIPGPADLPFVGTFHGKAGVQEWLGKTMEHLQFRALEPREFIAQGDNVAVLLHAELTITRTGREVSAAEVHLWTLRDGKVVRQQSFEDTAAFADAYRGR
jgi:hypothetical protein